MLFTQNKLLFFVPKQYKFLDTVFNNSRKKLNKIYDHSFHDKLLNGSLPEEIFGTYLINDYKYLKQFSATIIKLSQRANDFDPDLAKNLQFLAKDIIGSEQKMQLKYNKYFKNPVTYKALEAIPSYINYQKDAVDNAEFAVALSCILPCFWVYYQLGILASNKPIVENNPYQIWINSYKNNQKFADSTKILARKVDEYSYASDLDLQGKILKAFDKGVEHELHFFNEVCENFVQEQDLHHGSMLKIA